ncbi:MAG: SLC13 family permease [Nakamurella sp.]
MSTELISIVVLGLVFLIGTVRSTNLGALALVAAFVLGVGVLGLTAPETLAGFPADLFVILVGVTYLFAIAKSNGTVDWLVQQSVRAVRGHIAAIPWIMFGVSFLLVSLGAVSPAAVAIVAPIGMTFAVKYHINPLMMGLMVVHGSAAGNFSPVGVLGVITNGVVARSGIDASPTVIYLSNLLFNLLLGVIIYVVFGGLSLLRERRRAHEIDDLDGDLPAGSGGTAVATRLRLDRDRTLTVAGIAALGIGALVFSLDVGLTAMSVAVILTVLSPQRAKGAVAQVSWPTVLLICGIVTYIGLMQKIGTVDYLAELIGQTSAPVLAALLVCYIAAIVSAFASTTGILGALIPLAVPLLAAGQVSAVGLVAALSISASVVDSSPFSTNGALVVANAPTERQDSIYRWLLAWGFGLVLVAPVVTWFAFVVVAG